LNSKKKIIFLGPAHPFRGGIASSSERLAEALQDLGHDVKMYTFTTQYPKLIFPGKSQYTDSKAPKNLKIERLYSSINPLSWIKLSKRLKKEQPDLIINRFWLPYLGMSSAYLMNQKRLAANTKTTTIVDNLFPHQNMPGDKYCINYFMRSHNDFIVMSSSVGSEIADNFEGKNVELILHPVYDNYGESISKLQACQNLDLDPQYNYVLFFGFIKPYKGLDLLLKSIDKNFFKSKNLKLLIAGEVYGSDEKYHKLIKDLELESEVIFHNKYIGDSEVASYFCASDLVAQTYLSATQSGISQIALYYEKAVLVTDVGGLGEMVIHNKTGYVVDKDTNTIASAISDFFTNERKSEFKTDIKSLKAENTWERFAEKLLNFMFEKNK